MTTHPKNHSHDAAARRGFSLLELVIVLVISVVLAMVTAQAVKRSQEAYSESAAVEQSTRSGINPFFFR